MKKTATLVFLILAIALLFAGCRSQTNNSISIQDSIPLNGSNTIEVNSDSFIDAGDLETSEIQSNSFRIDSQSIGGQNISTKNSRGDTMKQLSDFKEISATQATIRTSKGAVTIELYREQTPITTANFLELAESGFYNGVRFHRIIENFMAQVGDPLSKDLSAQNRWGTGGPGYVIPDEFVPELKHDSAGVVSMANAGPNTGGSQFFITYEPTPWLDGAHTVFGRVTSGMDVVERLEIGDVIESIELR